MIHHHIHKKIHQLRQQPEHVRERILLVCMAILAPILFSVWIATFRFTPHDSEIQKVQEVKSKITATYKDTVSAKDLNINQ